MRYLLTLPQRFVKVDCLAVASELFGLQGVALQFTETAGRVSELVSRVPQAQTMDDWMAQRSPRASRVEPLRHRYRKDAPAVDPLFHLGEARRTHQLIHFLLRPPSHHPGLSAAMTGQRPRNELELRVPWLVGVHQIAANRQAVLRRRRPKPGWRRSGYRSAPASPW